MRAEDHQDRCAATASSPGSQKTVQCQSEANHPGPHHAEWDNDTSTRVLGYAIMEHEGLYWNDAPAAALVQE